MSSQDYVWCYFTSLNKDILLNVGGPKLILCSHIWGFRLVRPDGEKVTIRDKDLFKSIQDGTVDVPSITEEEIRDRSKGDPIAKSIVVIQATWFVIQAIHPLSQHLAVTDLVFTTLAHTLVNFFVYWCW